MKRHILIGSLILLSIQALATADVKLVPQQYSTIQSAINDADDGDIVIVYPGVYTGTGNVNLDFSQGLSPGHTRAITVQSAINPANPNPVIIASTIIDCGGVPSSTWLADFTEPDNGVANRAFKFHSGEGNDSKVIGFTIRNGYARGRKGSDGYYGYNGDPPYDAPFHRILRPYSDINPLYCDVEECPPLALFGDNAFSDGYGGAILCMDGSSPTIQYCVITDCTVTGAHGGRGADGLVGPWAYYTLADVNNDATPYPDLFDDAEPTETSDGQWGGRGGDGDGTGYGGAIACIGNSNPVIIDCNISNNLARGGCGGFGGNGGSAEGEPPNDYQGEGSFGGNAGQSRGDGIGGGIYADGSSGPIITNCIFRNNVATTGERAMGGLAGPGRDIATDAGGPATDGSDGLVYSDHGIAGGAAYYESTSATVNFTNCTFADNKAYEAFVDPPPIGLEDISGYTRGGAVNSETGNIVNLNNCDFTDNLGGALYCRSNTTLNLDNCMFTGNSDPDDTPGFDYASGGALYIGINGFADINNCSFVGNSAENDGGAVKCISDATFTNCSFGSNIASDGFGGAVDALDTGLTLDFNNCSFSGNEAVYGGGFSTEDSDATFTNCYFIFNTAQRGGGLDVVDANLSITNGIIMGNSATSGDGGGLLCSVSKAEIRNSVFSDNSASGVYPSGGSGGAINFYGGFVTHLISNCLITGNTSTNDGGGISCKIFAYPEIKNCTFSGDLTDGYGGAIFSDFSSDPNITDCIVKGCNSHAIHEEDWGGDATARYCLFHGNPDGDYYDSYGYGTGLVYTGPGQVGSIPGGVANIYANPLFTAGPFGSFYLSQTAAGQGSNSPAINNGSDTAANLGLDIFTTRTDNVGDSGQVDRGYHYPDSTGVAVYHLTASVTGGNGTISPTSGDFSAGAVVTLTATPSPGWRVKNWSGTGSDASTNTTNAVIMNTDKTVGVEFEQPRTLIVAIGGGQQGYYSNIQDAVGDARDDDTVVVYPGVYYGGVYNYSLIVDKSITIRSRYPDDPTCVASTVIDGYLQSPYQEGHTNLGIIIIANAVVLNGFTIQNCGGHFTNGRDGDRDVVGPNGEDGTNGYGAAIRIYGNDHIIENCVMRDNVVIGGSGGNGTGATQDENAGRGGWGGYAWGGAVYFGPDTSSTFINCQVIDNEARGGNGGDGGDDAFPGGEENYGGNWSMLGTASLPAIDWDPYSLNFSYVIGDLWEVWGYLGDYRWYSGYGGGVFVDENCNIDFIDCTINGNTAKGGMSGQGGQDALSQRPEEPLIPYEIPSFGGGVYCAANSNVTFTGCTIMNNISSEPNDPPNHRRDPYLGHGGGICAEDTATLVFNDCTFNGNDADSGGGLQFSNANATISDCNFTFNSAAQGGGMFCENGSADILHSKFINNVAFSDINDPNVLGAGGGLHIWSVDADIIDCNISGNQAEASGGGAFFGGESTPVMKNCLVTNNTAGRDGGGATTNTFSSLTVSNCTVAENEVTGIGFAAGYGGGLYCSYESYVNVIDSIIWGNSGQIGPQLAIKTSFQSSQMDVSYSDIQNGQSYVFVDAGSVLNWGAGNIHTDPRFAIGPRGDYYLGRIITGQPFNSPCIDSGSDSAVHLGMNLYTTRTDEQPDRDVVDMGYHHPVAPEAQLCRFCELLRDGIVNFKDFAMFALSWLDEGCAPANDWCWHADVTLDGYVDVEDADLFAQCWLVEDIYAPAPNPSQWATEPYSSSSPNHPNSISMVAQTAVDAWDYWVGDVQYYFDCVSGDCNDSGWQDEPSYMDTDLVIGNEYGYRVRARDASEQIPLGDMERGNKTDWSPIRYAIVGQEPPPPPPPTDNDPPIPDPMTWAVVPDAISPTAISMTATTAVDANNPPVQYYFECINDGNKSSSWQSSPSYTASGLTPQTEYSFRVMARDNASIPNVTGWSADADATTPEEVLPNQAPAPVLWEVLPYETGGGMDAYANMTAAEAIDPEGNTPVQYFFQCVSVPAYNSGWTEDREWNEYPIGRAGKALEFHFKVRDSLGKESNWSTSWPCYP